MNENLKLHLRQIGVPALIAFLSITLLFRIFSSDKTLKGTTSYLDEKEKTVLSLTAISTGASFAISAIPDDVGTPLAEKFADLSDYFIAISVAILFEKYLAAISGIAAFRILVPIAMVLLAGSFYWAGGKERLRQIMGKLLIFSIVIVAVVPLSAKVSKAIDAAYQNSINETIDMAKADTDQLNLLNGEETQSEAASETGTEVQSETDPENDSLWDSIAGTVTGALDTAGNAIESAGQAASGAISSLAKGTEDLLNNFKNTMNNMVNYIAVLIVTSCVIPLAVLFFLIWVLQLLFGISLPLLPPRRTIGRRTAGPLGGQEDSES